MRLATSLVAALLASASLATPIADACGGGDYGPRAPAMFLVSNHNGRTFVLLDKRVPSLEGLAWTGETMTYDHTLVAAAPAFPTARKLTLVGAEPSRRLASATHVFVQPAWDSHHPMNAQEIYPRGEERARIAVDGQFTTTVWNGLAQQDLGLETVAWAQHPGFTPPLDPRLMSLWKVVGTDVELITAYTYGTDGVGVATTYLRTPGAQPTGGWLGSPIGVVTLDGTRYLVLVNDGLVTPVAF
jgi:hypothetical protein